MMYFGIAAVGLGGVAAIVSGVVFLGLGLRNGLEGGNISAATGTKLKGVAIGGGALAVLVGVPLAIAGGIKVTDGEAASVAPNIRVGAGTVSMDWSF